MTCPRSITEMESASWSASSRYWVVSRTVVPSPTRSRMTSQSPSRACGSRPVVGSSRNSTGGLITSAPARSTRRRIPPEKPFNGRSAASVRSKASSSSSARRFAWRVPIRYSLPTSTRFSRAVSTSSTAAYWPDVPISGRTFAGLASTSIPATLAFPDSGRSRVVKTFTKVVFPAPLGPSKPRTVPCSTERLSPSRARTGPVLV